MSITAAGVGIGTSSPSSNLVVQGGTNTGIFKLSNNTDNANDSWWMGFNHNTSADSTDRARIGCNIHSSGAGRLFFTTGLGGSQTEKMRIDENGNIGVGTTSPETKFHVAGGNILSSHSTNGTRLTLRSGTSGQNSGLSTILIGGDANHYSSITAQHISNGHTYLAFGTCSAPGDPTERVRIDKDGNVGIGTTAPDTTLTIRRTGAANYIKFTGSDNQQVGIQIGDSSTRWWVYKEANRSDLSFYDGGTEWMTLKYATGRLGLSTSSPGYKLDVQGGDINASGSVRSNGTALTSDQRVKENIIDADTNDNLSHILDLQVKYYDYTQAFVDHTGRPDESNYGFIAQQVKQIIPNAVDIQPVTLQKDIITEVPVLDEEGNVKLDEEGNEMTYSKTERIVVEEIPDFHFLKKELIFTEAVGAIQELHKQFQNEKNAHDETKEELNTLKLFLQSKYPGEI
jgi:hypothetical protein